MENRGVFNRQWKLRPIVPYHISVLPRPKLSQAHGSDAKRVKNGKESCQKRQVEQRKHYLSLARKSFKNWENIKRKRETGNIRRKRELIPAKTGELKSLNNSAHGLICLERKENQYYTDCTYSC